MKVATAKTLAGVDVEFDEDQDSIQEEPLQEVIFYRCPDRQFVQALAPMCVDLTRWKLEGEEWQPKANLWRFFKETLRG